jgi:hypothetical protein
MPHSLVVMTRAENLKRMSAPPQVDDKSQDNVKESAERLRVHDTMYSLSGKLMERGDFAKALKAAQAALDQRESTQAFLRAAICHVQLRDFR